MEATRTCISKYATVSGRASRAGFRWFVAARVPACLPALAALRTAFPSFPGYFLNPQRFGETLGKLVVPSEPGPNKHGPNPLEVTR